MLLDILKIACYNVDIRNKGKLNKESTMFETITTLALAAPAVLFWVLFHVELIADHWN